MGLLEFALDVFLRILYEEDDIVLARLVFQEMDGDCVCEDVQSGFKTDGHAIWKLLGEHSGQGRIHFGGWRNSAVEFQDTSAEIGGEHHVDNGDFGLVSFGHVGYCLLKTHLKISVFVQISSAVSNSEATYQEQGSSISS